MARATRSAAAQHHQERDRQPDPSTATRPKPSTKKRKRPSLPDNDDQPPPKQHLAENGIKDERNDDTDENLSVRKLPDLELAGDVPMDPSDAQQILDILDLIDTQGLLDRVFPLPSSDLSGPSTSKSQSGTYSLRTLLRESSQHPLHVLRTAVQNLFPISYNSRSRTSSPAAQQLRFCHLAQSLLDQASCHSVPLPLDIETILSDVPEPPPENDNKPAMGSPHPEKPSHNHRNRKYALMQRLPSGTWWSSLNSDLIPTNIKAISDMQTANAALVAVLPSSSNLPPSEVCTPGSTAPEKPSSITLGTYSTKKPPGHKQKLPGPRRVSCGSFLDYGPYTSFAPSFDQDGVEVGRGVLGEVLWSWEERKKRWAEQDRCNSEIAGIDRSGDVSSPLQDTQQTVVVNGIDTPPQMDELVDDDSFEGLFSKEQIRLLKEALVNLELEDAIQELLERNARALKRLGELQNLRLMAAGGFTPVQEGSEEWEIAQGIYDSLTLLTSLRPRSSSTDVPPLVPSASALRKLHRTLPTAPTQGWYGTLPPARPTALRDDSTLYIKSTATTLPSSTPAASTPTSTAQTTPSTTVTPAQPYPAYSYNYAAPYRTGYQFKASPTYYPNAYTTPATGQTQTSSQYYPSQQYSTTGQQQYAYSWYQYTPQAQAANATSAAATATTAQTGTSQPVPALPTSYASFFSANAQTPGQRAVANTVLTATSAAKPYQPAAGVATSTTWPAGATATAGYVTPSALPPHMRPAVSTGQAGAAAGTYTGGYTATGYYGAYQATSSPAQS
ncbi:hypothetical protein ID866_373 [Astraeus odoratus]|nr:hypothetical protein ID866_373 [Astraeus odoratus]